MRIKKRIRLLNRITKLIPHSEGFREYVISNTTGDIPDMIGNTFGHNIFCRTSVRPREKVNIEVSSLTRTAFLRLSICHALSTSLSTQIKSEEEMKTVTVVQYYCLHDEFGG